ncbi:F-box/LRR-repeat protein 4 [Biomphalaria pfeifferi]|nr:F-box/LRR-repeat protein 4 [Biomphalaria pfeifferi]
MKGSRRDSRPRSLCARCGNIRELRPESPGRSAWRDAGRSLSLEVHGREGRRRNSSSESSNGRQRGSPLHCYIVPINSQNSSAARSTTTYRESFQKPPNQPTPSRYSRSVPSSPVPASPLWSPLSASPRGTPTYNRQESTQALLSKVPSRLQSSQSMQPAGKVTTYRDHFNWFS